MDLESTSKLISLILRHKPETVGITLDEHGWADVQDLIRGIQKKRPFDMETLEEIVRTDSKQRYSFNEDKTLIRANQGHSIQVDVELPVAVPPQELYHGTGQKYAGSIDKTGLLPKSRLYVHLSGDTETAIKVGSRHGKPVVYRVKSGQMQKDGYVFYRSVNGVWLTERVPVEYLEKVKTDERKDLSCTSAKKVQK
ncbi:MAG: RNA 2'-phosphotransferase [Lachnospiraceae bacterium]|nr:RNA 2'-phosphotransferase [Lachnospiraceae bacterium]